MKNDTAHGYLPGIDGLRCLGILAVVMYHSDFFPFLKGGFTGVDVFFVISGYMISRSLYNRPSLQFPCHLSEFYKRRIIRIIPALVVCLIVTIIASTLFIPSSWLSDIISKTGLSAFLGYSNFTLVWNSDRYFAPRAEFNPFLHTWTLAIEEQFYLLFPIIYYVWLRFRKDKSAAGSISWLLLAVLGVSSLGLAFIETTANHDRAFYLLPSRFWELAAGALLFQLHSNSLFLPKSKSAPRMLMIAGLLLLGASFAFADSQAFPFPWAMVPVLATTLLLCGIVGTTNRSSLVHRFLSSSVMIYIGKISYSLYLWHWPIAVLLRWTIGFDTYWLLLLYLAAALVLATASYRYVETLLRTSPFLLKQKNSKTIVSSIAVLLILFFTARFVAELQPTISLSVTKDKHVWRSGRYKIDEPEQTVSIDPNIAGRKIFILGDSHTAAYRTMLHTVSTQLGIEVYEYESGGCAIAGLLKPTSEFVDCTSFYVYSLHEIKELAEPGDILFLASLRMPELSSRFTVIDEAFVLAEFTSVEAAEDRQLALEEASQLIEEFDTLGVHVLIDAPKPVLRAPPYRCSDWFNRMNPICSPGLTVNRDVLLKVRQPVMDSLKTLQHRHQNLYVWDPLYVLCEEECSAYDDNGLPIFYDGDHLSAHGNRLLAPSFKEEIIAIWGHQDETAVVPLPAKPLPWLQ